MNPFDPHKQEQLLACPASGPSSWFGPASDELIDTLYVLRNFSYYYIIFVLCFNLFIIVAWQVASLAYPKTINNLHWTLDVSILLLFYAQLYFFYILGTVLFDKKKHLELRSGLHISQCLQQNFTPDEITEIFEKLTQWSTYSNAHVCHSNGIKISDEIFYVYTVCDFWGHIHKYYQQAKLAVDSKTFNSNPDFLGYWLWSLCSLSSKVKKLRQQPICTSKLLHRVLLYVSQDMPKTQPIVESKELLGMVSGITNTASKTLRI